MDNALVQKKITFEKETKENKVNLECYVINIHSIHANEEGGIGGGTMPPYNSLVTSLFLFLEFLFIPIKNG